MISICQGNCTPLVQMQGVPAFANCVRWLLWMQLSSSRSIQIQIGSLPQPSSVLLCLPCSATLVLSQLLHLSCCGGGLPQKIAVAALQSPVEGCLLLHTSVQQVIADSPGLLLLSSAASWVCSQIFGCQATRLMIVQYHVQQMRYADLCWVC